MLTIKIIDANDNIYEFEMPDSVKHAFETSDPDAYDGLISANIYNPTYEDRVALYDIYRQLKDIIPVNFELYDGDNKFFNLIDMKCVATGEPFYFRDSNDPLTGVLNATLFYKIKFERS